MRRKGEEKDGGREQGSDRMRGDRRDCVSENNDCKEQVQHGVMHLRYEEIKPQLVGHIGITAARVCAVGAFCSQRMHQVQSAHASGGV